MRKFAPRFDAPRKNDKHYYSNENIFYACGYGMPNCTAYAWGRVYELTGERFTNLCGNAEEWFNNSIINGFELGTTPRLGAIICWRGGDTLSPSDGAGHVAIVEEIKPNGDIIVSNSAWKGEEFYLMELKKENGYLYADNRPLLGFIYVASNLLEATEENNKKKVVHRVMCGSFEKRENAEKRVADLGARGYEACIMTFEV